MWQDLKCYMKTCPTCQRVKVNRHKHVKPVSFLTELTCFKTVHIILIGLVRESEGCKNILTVIDSRMLSSSSSTLVNQVDRGVERTWDLLDGIIRSTTPDNLWPYDVVNLLILAKQCEIFAIKHQTRTAYQPEANGMMEGWHRTLKTTIASMSNSNSNSTQMAAHNNAGPLS